MYRQRRHQRPRSSSEAEAHLIGLWVAATKLTAGCDNTGQSDINGRGLGGRTAPSLVVWQVVTYRKLRTQLP